MNNNYKIKYITAKIHGCGLGDAMYQLRIYVKVAHHLDCTLILPNAKKYYLNTKHNNNKIAPMRFEDYIDIESIKVNGERVKVISYETAKRVIKVEPEEIITTHRKNNWCKNIIQEIKKPTNVSIPLREDHITFGRNFFKKNDIEGIIHIRRGDRLKTGYRARISGKDYKEMSSVENILTLLDQKNAPRNIYVMTNASGKYKKKLKNSKKYNFLFADDFPELLAIQKRNNYELFNIEQSILLEADFGIRAHRCIIASWIASPA